MEKFVCVPTTFPLRKSPDFYLIFTFLFDIFILCLFSLSGYVRRSLVFFLWFGRERKTRRSYVLFAHRRRPAGGALSFVQTVQGNMEAIRYFHSSSENLTNRKRDLIIFSITKF